MDSGLRAVHRKFLITGAFGQLGIPLYRALAKKHGNDAILLTDRKEPTQHVDAKTMILDVTKMKQFEKVVVENKITDIIHLAAVLSALGEKKPKLAMKLNFFAVPPIFQLASKHKLSLFIPSTIGAFGAESPRNPTPDECVQRPKTLYGIGKVFSEVLGEYMHSRNGLNYRCLRYPGILSHDCAPGGGTTDYAIHMCKEAVEKSSYKCYLRDNTMLPMMHINDFAEGTVKFLDAPEECLTRRVYNVSAMSFTPKILCDQIKADHYPNFKVKYKVDDIRQGIADSWPQVLDDSNARKDWQWNPENGIKETVKKLIEGFKKNRDSQL